MSPILLVSLISLSRLASAGVSAGSLELPVADRGAIVDHYHGEPVPDPYRWLEEMESDATLGWVRGQDRATRGELEGQPERAALLRRLESYRASERRSVPQFRGDSTFFEVRRRDEEGRLHERLVVERHGESKVLVDSSDLPDDALFATYSGSGTASFQAGPHGRYLAFGVRRGSSIWTRWYVMDTVSGEQLPDEVRGISSRTASTVLWHPDGEGFFYAAFSRPEESESASDLELHSLFFHRVGSASSSDELIFRPEDPGQTLWPTVTSDGRVLAWVGQNGEGREIRVMDLENRQAGARQLRIGEDGRYTLLDRVGNALWLVAQTPDAPGGRVLAVGLGDGVVKVVVPEPSNGAIVTARIFGERLLVQRTEHATPRLDLYHLDGTHAATVELPYIGWIRSGLVGTRSERRAAFAIQGTADPGAVYELDMESGRTALFHRAERFESERYVTRRVFYPASDGTLIPLFLMHRRDLVLDASNPVWLYAYGSAWAASPWYQTQHRLWLELGGVYALAHVRGGGEYGSRWIEAGSGRNKQTGIDDFVNAAEWLVRHRYTSPERLLVNGGSASGPLAAAAVNENPDLFRVALISYPMTDMLRAHDYASPLLTGVFDTPETVEAYRALRAWSPYQNVREGRCYPATFVAHGDQDRTAVPLHSYKLTAALQHGQACDRPIRLQIAWGRGHTVGGLEERANQVAFAVRELGLEVPTDW